MPLVYLLGKDLLAFSATNFVLGPRFRVSASQVSGSQCRGSRVSGFQVPGYRVPGLGSQRHGSQVLILDYAVVLIRLYLLAVLVNPCGFVSLS